MESPINRIIDYERGELNERQILELCRDLENLSLLGQLQGSYGRLFRHFTECRLLYHDGQAWQLNEELLEEM